MLKEKKIKIIVVKPKCQPEVVEVDNELPVFQHIVEGYLESLTMGPYIIICNEEGKLNKLPPNRFIDKYNDIICGTFFLVKNKGPEFTSFSQKEVNELLQLYSLDSKQFQVFL